MKKAILFILVLNCFYKTILYSQCITQGPHNANVVSGNISPGDQSWANANYAKTSNDFYASGGFVLTLLSTSPTKYLTASDYQFNIPANAIINGIQVDIKRLSTGINLLAKIEDESVRIMKNGVFVGQDKASNNYWPIFNAAYQTYGGPNDLWGTTWTPADINASNFGAGISARLTGLLMLLPSANIDHIRITVNYSTMPSLSCQANTICAGDTAWITASGNTTYTWSAGLTSVADSVAIATPSVTTTYTVTGGIGNCFNTNTITVNVNPVPVVGISSTFSAATICEGDSISLSAGAASSYTWSPPLGLSSLNTANVMAGPNVTTTYSLFATGANGCDNSLSPATFMVNVNSAPVLTLNSTANTICNGGSTILGASGASSYTWSPAVGLSAVNAASVIANPSVTTVYQVIGESSNGCHVLSVSTVTVTVSNSPSLNLSSMSPANTICQGNNTILSASGASSYTWSPSTGLSSATGANVIANPTVTTVYTVNATVSGGCSGSVTPATLTITVNNGPSVTSSALSNTICEGANVPLSAGGATSYSWSPASGLNTTSGASVIANPSVTTVYTVMATAANGCNNVLNPTVFSVVVNPAPDLNFNSTSLNNTICQGTSATLTATGANTYTWSPSAGLSSTQGAMVVANPTATTVYTITATAANGCGNASGPATLTVTVNSLPTVSVSSTASGNSMCNGSNIALTASGSGSYLWSPSGSLNTAVGANVIASPSVTTVYSVVAQSSNGCSNMLNPHTVTVTVNPVPVISLLSNMQGDTICLGQSITIHVVGSASTYTWSNGMSSQSITVNPTINTVYDVLSTNAFNCSASASMYVVVADPATLVLALSGFNAGTTLNTPVTTTVSAGAIPNAPQLITITQNPAHGTATIANGVISYTPANNYDGTDTVYYSICDMHCASACKTAKLAIFIESGIVIPGILSPNGDGVHDDFYIKGLGKYKEPELIIFNRWGDVVYSSKPYGNDWHGQTSSSSMKLTGSEVLDGTYFYLLTLDPESKPMKGFFEIKRK